MIYKILEGAGIYALARHAALVARATAKRSAVFAVALIFAIAGLGFFISAIWLSLAAALGAIAASLWVGGGLFAVALLLVMVGVIVGRVGPPPAQPQAALPEAIETAAQLLADVQQQFKGKKGSGLQAAAAAAALGFVVARLLRK